MNEKDGRVVTKQFALGFLVAALVVFALAVIREVAYPTVGQEEFNRLYATNLENVKMGMAYKAEAEALRKQLQAPLPVVVID